MAAIVWSRAPKLWNLTLSPGRQCQNCIELNYTTPNYCHRIAWWEKKKNTDSVNRSIWNEVFWAWWWCGIKGDTQERYKRETGFSRYSFAESIQIQLAFLKQLTSYIWDYVAVLEWDKSSNSPTQQLVCGIFPIDNNGKQVYLGRWWLW